MDSRHKHTDAKYEAVSGKEVDTASKNPTDFRWDPSWRQVRPILGIMALVLSIVCMLASLAILLASQGVPINSWKIQPTVYLAIASAVGAGAVRYAHSHAVRIA